MRGYSGFDRFISARGGIVTRRELLDAGWTPDEVYFGREYGNLRRIRHGWYAASDLPPLVRLGWAAGGPLACVSALLHHGVLAPVASENAQRSIHIALPSHGNRLRTRTGVTDGVIVVTHWGDEGRREALAPVPRWREADPALATTVRHAVSVELAREQLAHCRNPTTWGPRVRRA
jgi:hypothetical protein